MEDKIFTVEEVAELFKVKATTIRTKLRKKELKGFKIGKSWRITREAIYDFCNNEIEKIEKDGG